MRKKKAGLDTSQQFVWQICRHSQAIVLLVIFIILLTDALPVYAEVKIKPLDSKAGYIVRLLLNETPFPGERGWVSEQNSKDTMLEILWVCHGRMHYIPPGYRQEEIATLRTSEIIDVITAGGQHGQCEGFYRDGAGKPCVVPRIDERLEYLLKIANTGKPGKYARLIQYAQGLADAYVSKGIKGASRFAGLTTVHKIPVTGGAYSWMTDKDCYNPGGSYIRIPDEMDGSLGGNRFFTLKKRNKK